MQKAPARALLVFHCCGSLKGEKKKLKHPLNRSLVVACTSLDLWHKDLVEEESIQNYKKHQLVLLLFVIVLHVEWLFKAQIGG